MSQNTSNSWPSSPSPGLLLFLCSLRQRMTPSHPVTQARHLCIILDTWLFFLSLLTHFLSKTYLRHIHSVLLQGHLPSLATITSCSCPDNSIYVLTGFSVSTLPILSTSSHATVQVIVLKCKYVHVNTHTHTHTHIHTHSFPPSITLQWRLFSLIIKVKNFN